ncbi:alpha/beta fold hydrolase [Pseudactinotalea sp.]|uniref:alpha/beta fold hydrolase n=1 Tax=Pseudactinotalea sp. TaxID=1926260 RepID=UPI003B3A2CBB
MLTGGNVESRAVPMLLLHGGGSDNSGISWFHSFTALGADRRLIAIDLPGFGGTQEIPPLHGPKPMADFVARVAHEVGVSSAIVVGVSMGGDVALNVALRHPGLVAGLVLISPGGLAPRVKGPFTHRFAWLGAQLPDWLLLPLSRVANMFTGSVIRAIVADPTTLPVEVRDEFIRESRAPRAGIAYGRYNQATLGHARLTNDLTGEVSSIVAPTLLFHGLKDPIVDPEGSRRAAGLIRHARLVLLPNAGHWGQLEAHDTFATVTLEFLADIAPPPSPRPEPEPPLTYGRTHYDL